MNSVTFNFYTNYSQMFTFPIHKFIKVKLATECQKIQKSYTSTILLYIALKMGICSFQSKIHRESSSTAQKLQPHDLKLNKNTRRIFETLIRFPRPFAANRANMIYCTSPRGAFDDVSSEFQATICRAFLYIRRRLSKFPGHAVTLYEAPPRAYMSFARTFIYESPRSRALYSS